MVRMVRCDRTHRRKKLSGVDIRRGDPDAAHSFPYHLFWPLVIPQTEETGVTQLAFARPFGEADLRDELRFHPMHAVSRQPILSKGGNRCLKPCELLADQALTPLALTRARRSPVMWWSACERLATGQPVGTTEVMMRSLPCVLALNCWQTPKSRIRSCCPA